MSVFAVFTLFLTFCFILSQFLLFFTVYSKISLSIEQSTLALGAAV